jgi:hypothetical protein
MTLAHRNTIDEQRLAVETGEHVKIYNLERLVVTRRDATLILEPIALRPWPGRRVCSRGLQTAVCRRSKVT